MENLKLSKTEFIKQIKQFHKKNGSFRNLHHFLKRHEYLNFKTYVKEFGIDGVRVRNEKELFIIENNGRFSFCAHYNNRAVKSRSGFTYNVLRVKVICF